MDITEETPLDNFPLYYRLQKIVDPPPPLLRKCTETCDNAGGGGNFAYTNFFASFAECCELCKANKNCGAFVWGPYDVNKPASADNPLACFLLGKVLELRQGEERSFGCVR